MDTPINPSDVDGGSGPHQEGIPRRTRKNSAWELVAYALLIVVTMVRAGSTWRVFSQTTDEPMHFLSGFVWLEEKNYTILLDHPPLAHVLAAFPLWLAGVRDGHERDFGERINRMLMTGGRYEHNLALIRCGNLMFLFLAIVAVALWARRSYFPASGATVAALECCDTIGATQR